MAQNVPWFAEYCRRWLLEEWERAHAISEALREQRLEDQASAEASEFAQRFRDEDGQ